MFGRKKKPQLLYKIVNNAGFVDGETLEAGVPFTKTWSILNTAPASSKEKGKVAKIVHHSGVLLCAQINFLWPVPGKCVTVSFDLIAPLISGSYNSSWKLEGTDSVDFTINFSVSEVKAFSEESIEKMEEIAKEIEVKKHKGMANLMLTNEKSAKRTRSTRFSLSPGDTTKTILPARSCSLDATASLITKVDPPLFDYEEKPKNERSSVDFSSASDKEELTTENISKSKSKSKSKSSKKSKRKVKRQISNSHGSTSDSKISRNASEGKISMSSSLLKRSRKKKKRLSTTITSPHPFIGNPDDYELYKGESIVNTCQEMKIELDRLPRCLMEGENVEIPPIIEGNYRNPPEIILTSPGSSKTRLIPTPERIEEEKEEKTKPCTEDLIVVRLRKSKENEAEEEGMEGTNKRTRTKRNLSLSLVERWQETIISNASRDLTETQYQKQKKISEVSMSMKNLFGNLKIAPRASPKKEDLITQILDSSRRLEANTHPTSPITISGATLLSEVDVALQKYIASSDQLLQQLTDIQIHSNTIASMSQLLENTKREIVMARESMDKNDNVGSLHDYLWIKIFSYLSASDLISISLVNKQWNSFSNHNQLWERQLRVRSGEGDRPIPLNSFVNSFSSKHLYKIQMNKKWFDTTQNWKEVDSTKNSPSSTFSWPVYDLEVVDHTLVTVSDCLRVFDLSGKHAPTVLPGHHKVVTCVKMTNNGKACITGSVDNTVKIWSLSSKKCLRTLEGHKGPISAIEHTKRLIFSTSLRDKVLKVWEKATGTCSTFRFDENITCLAMNLTKATNHVYLGHSDGMVTTWDFVTQQAIQKERASFKSIESLQVVGDSYFVSDYSQLFMRSFGGSNNIVASSIMTKNVGKLEYDGYKLGAQIGSRLNIFDVRYLFDIANALPVDNLWKGAFQFKDDYVIVGGGSGKTTKVYPTL